MLKIVILLCLFVSHSQAAAGKVDSVGLKISQYRADSSEMVFRYRQYRKDSAAGRWESALFNLKRAVSLRKITGARTNADEISAMEKRFRTAQKEKQIMLLKSRAKMQQHNISASEITRKYTFAVIVLLLLISGLLFYSYRIRGNNIKTLKRQKDYIDGQNRELRTVVESKIRLLDEKELLLRELHHRVKNNLQLINSMLSLHKGYLKSKEATLAIFDTQNRIRSMSIIHQRLYQSGNQAMLNIGALLHELIGHLKGSFSAPANIEYVIDTGEIELEISSAIPIGLIITEIIVNTIKYPVSEDGRGMIKIALKRMLPGNQYCLEISDQATGSLKAYDLFSGNSLEGSLINRFSEQLNAKFRLFHANGILYQLVFEPRKPDRHDV